MSKKNNKKVVKKATKDVTEEVTQETNKVIHWLNEKMFKGKLYTWIAVYAIGSTVFTVVTPMATPVVENFFPGEEKQQEEQINKALEEQKKMYDALLEEYHELDEQEDASYQLQIDLLKKELDKKEEEIKTLQTQLESQKP